MSGFQFLRETVIAVGRASQLSHRDFRILLAMRLARLIAAAIVLCAVFQPAAVAITINMSYFNEGDPIPHDENPNWDPAGTVLKSHFQTAKAIWENLLPGSGSYDYEFEWDDDIDPLGLTSPDLLSPGDWIIELNSTKYWFADPTPSTNEEFETTPIQKLYGQLSESEKSTYFPGASPPLALETGFSLRGISGTTGQGGYDSHDGFDLLSVIRHEIGHGKAEQSETRTMLQANGSSSRSLCSREQQQQCAALQ